MVDVRILFSPQFAVFYVPMDPGHPNLTPAEKEAAQQRVEHDYQQRLERWKRDNERYLEDRRSRISAYRDAEKTHDQWILTLSGSLLALSMTFLKDIVGSSRVEHSSYLLASSG
jgi:hypothetical protein